MKTCGKTLKNLTNAPGASLSNSGTTHELQPYLHHHTPAHADVLFRKSHRGTFFGFVVMSGMFVSIVLFFFSANSDNTEVKIHNLFC